MKQILAGKSFSLVLLALTLSACGGGGGGGGGQADTTAPTLTQVTAVLPNTRDNTPSYTFNSTEAGRIDYSGGCIPSDLNARSGNNTVTFRQLSDRLYDTCRLTVTDASGNESEELAVSPFTVDTVLPTLSTTTAIITSSQNRTPVYVFNSSEAGALTLTGGCTSTMDAAVNGTNEITFNSLEDGTYNCTVTVTDAALNARTLTIPAFTVDNVAPGLVQVTPVSDWVRARTANYAFSSNEIGTISYGGDCTSSNVDAVSAINNVVVLSMARDGTHNNCTLTVEDLAGNVSEVLAINNFTVDTIAPTLTQSDAVFPSVTNDSTPQFSFNSTEPGTILFMGGLCRSVTTTTAASGSTRIVFNPLIDGTHNCTLRVTDDAGNASELLTIPTFRVVTTGPVLTAGTPISELSNNRSPSYQFGSNETGTVTFSAQCGSPTATAVTGGYRIDFSNLSDNTYSGCVITVTDVVGNHSSLAIADFEVDATAPELTEGTPVAALSNNRSPEYSFTSTEIHTVTFDGACAAEAFSPSFEVDGDTITVSFVNLSDANYTDCDVIVSDEAQNASTLEIPDFTVDATAPVLEEVTPIAERGSNRSPNYEFSSNETGTVTFSAECGSPSPVATELEEGYRIAFSNLSDRTYSGCVITVTDEAQNASTLTIPDFTVDTGGPEIAAVGAMPDTVNGHPVFTFSSDEVGEIRYAGDCASATDEAIDGNNPITLGAASNPANSLSDGPHSNCTVQVVDDAGNVSNVLALPAFVVDATAPLLDEETAIATLTNDNTPTYEFSSDEAGTISYGGLCQSGGTSADVGFNTITFNQLGDASYDTCTLTVTDAVGNAATLNISDFRIDITPPSLTGLVPVASPTNAVAPSVVFNSDEVGTITHNGACGFINLAAQSGSNTVTFNGLIAGDYTCTLTVTDEAQNASTLNIPTFTIDRIAPSLAQVTPVRALGNDNTPSYTFSSSEAGTISYQNCAFDNEEAIQGNNTITFSALVDATYSNCRILVTDDAGNSSTPLTVTEFEIDTLPPVLTEVAQVPNDYTQTYTFHSTEEGSVTYRGSCAASLEDALDANNVITLETPEGNPLPVRFYQDCTIQVTDAAGNDSAQLEISAFRVGKPLNDTGITLCGDFAFNSSGYVGSGIHNNNVDCINGVSPSVTETQDGFEIGNGRDVVPAGQDAVHGRDADPATNEDSDGLAGFSYTKLGADGEPLAAQDASWSDTGNELDGTKWSCVQDNVTGLTWEVKTNDGGLHDVDHGYSWYNSTGINNGGSAGWPDDVTRNDCYNTTRCDTEKYVADVNAEQLCGHSDWRLPSINELRSLRSPNVLNNLNRAFFHHVRIFGGGGGERLWSSTPNAQDSRAWYFQLSSDETSGGFFGTASKSLEYTARLVRSNQR